MIHFNLYIFCRYPNRIFVEYSIDCSGSDLAFINFSYFHLQGECNRYNNISFKKVLLVKSVCRCEDYRTDFITVDRGGNFGKLAMCENSINPSLVLDLQRQWSENLRVTFHTSATNRYPGFEMYIICFNPPLPPRG